MTREAATAREWAEEQFEGAEFSDIRRIGRAITIAEALMESPGTSLPQLFARPYDLKAAYRFFRHPEVQPDTVQAGHREQVFSELEKPGRYLLLEDTTEILCAGDEEIAGLGPVGGSKASKIGFHLHSVFAVRWLAAPEQPALTRPVVTILGLADQQAYVRQPRAATGPRRGSERRRQVGDTLESGLWERATRRLGVAPDEDSTVWVRVCDRGADIYDHLRYCQLQRHRFLVRAAQDRVLEGKPAGKLFAVARASASLGTVRIELRARPGQAARTASMHLSVTRVQLPAPQALGSSCGQRPSVTCTVVRVWEAAPLGGGKRLEWLLLTDLPAESFAQACEIAQMYATRWLEEEFHKALKTGLGVERLQLTTAHAWVAATAVLSIVAVRLLELRERLRQTPTAPAEGAGLTEVELSVLRARSGKALLTVGEVALALGRLGGHLNRTGDGWPGWLTLWRGWQVLQTLIDGVLLARKLDQFG